MLDRIENTISRYSMIPAAGRLGVAVSGGADSVFLLRYLADRGGVELAVIHLNHGLRGAESEADEVFAAGLAAELGLPFHGRRMESPAGNLEQFCRRARLAFFGSLIERGFVTRVATGHTASDQAETVLMRILRGAGPPGLRGILPVMEPGIVRPLLAVRREEVRAWLVERGLQWREDGSNASKAFLRNRVRATVLPSLRAEAPGVDEALVRLADIASEEEEYWQIQTEEALGRVGHCEDGAWILDCREAKQLHRALLARVIRMAIGRTLGGLKRVEHAHFERVRALVLSPRGHGREDFPGGRAWRSMDWIRIEAAAHPAIPFDTTICVPGEHPIPGFTVETWLSTELPSPGRYTEGEGPALDWERLRLPLRLRTGNPGDRFQPAGAPKARSIKELFEQARVPSWERRFWPMITDSDGIVWIRRFGVAEGAGAVETTRVRLYVRCVTVSSKLLV